MALAIVKNKTGGKAAMQALRAMAKAKGSISTAQEIAANDPCYDSAVVDLIKAKVLGYKSVGIMGALNVPFTVQTDAAIEIAQLAFEQSIPGQLMNLGARKYPFGCKINAIKATGTDWAGVLGESKAIKVSMASVDSGHLNYFKLASLAVITDELLQYASQGTDQAIRDVMITEAVKKIDTLFLSDTAAVKNVSPAGIMAGADSTAKTIAELFKKFADNNNLINGAVLVRPVADILAMKVEDYTNMAKLGVTVIGSQFATKSILINPGALAINIAGADIEVSNETSVDMQDDPAAGTTPKNISAFQTNASIYKMTGYFGWANITGKAVVCMGAATNA